MSTENAYDKVKNQIALNLVQCWNEYVQETEHQEGQEYWDSFNTQDEIMHDFLIYLVIKYKDKTVESGNDTSWIDNLAETLHT